MTPDRTTTILASLAVALCGAMWGVFWMPLRWLDGMGAGAGWVSLIFNLSSMLAALPFLGRRDRWNGVRNQVLPGLMLGSAFTLYTVSLVLTDVLHAILLFYLTPVWSTLAGWLLLGGRLSASRLIAILLGFAGMSLIFGITESIPLPRNSGDWIALASGMLWSAGSLRSYANPSRNTALTVFSFASGGFVSSAAMLAVAHLLSLPFGAAGSMVGSLHWIVLFALVFFVPPNFLVLWATQRIDPGRVGILLMTEVVVGSISAALFSGDGFGPADAAGTVMIVAAGLVEVLGRR